MSRYFINQELNSWMVHVLYFVSCVFVWKEQKTKQYFNKLHNSLHFLCLLICLIGAECMHTNYAESVAKSRKKTLTHKIQTKNIWVEIVWIFSIFFVLTEFIVSFLRGCFFWLLSACLCLYQVAVMCHSIRIHRSIRLNTMNDNSTSQWEMTCTHCIWCVRRPKSNNNSNKCD